MSSFRPARFLRRSCRRRCLRSIPPRSLAVLFGKEEEEEEDDEDWEAESSCSSGDGLVEFSSGLSDEANVEKFVVVGNFLEKHADRNGIAETPQSLRIVRILSSLVGSVAQES